MDKTEMEKRTKDFALQIISFIDPLPRTKTTDVLGYQLLKSGTSAGANYREANRAVSRPDFINKIGIVEKELGETEYWLQLFEDIDKGDRDLRRRLLKECGELLSIFVSIGKSTKRNNPKSQFRNPNSEIRNE
jgi:four helix bundle protein